MFAWKRSLTVKSQIWHTFVIENKSKNNIDEFIVQDLPREKFCDAVDHMVEHFLTDEPICKTKQIRNDKVALNEVCNLWKNVLEQNLVLVCYKKGSDEIIGLNMLCVITRDEYMNFKFEISKHNTWKAIHDVALARFNLFERYKDADKILIAYGLSVSKFYRRRGIGTEILRARIPLCRALKIPLTSTVFTALGSQRPAEKIGFKVDFEISYDELRQYSDEFKLDNLETSSLKVMSLVIEENGK